jgi:CRP/FNR family transcriptional regulator, cyclic AMP receptor protein
MNENAAKEVLARTGWLLDQPEWVRETVLAASKLQAYESERFVFYTGDEPGGMYGVVDGGFGLIIPSGPNEMLLCNILRCGYWFGYGPMLSSGGRKVTIKAVEKSHLLHLPLRAMATICAERPEFFRILGALNDIGLMMNSLQVVGDLLIPSAERRIAAVIARIAKPIPGADDQAPWPIRISQAEIGQMSNASRDRVNRALAKFARAGWVTVDFKMIVVTGLGELEKFAASPTGRLED